MGARSRILPIYGILLLMAAESLGQLADELGPSRDAPPSVQFGQGFQDIAPSPAPGKPGTIQTLPKVEPPEGSQRGREVIITADLKGLVFVEKEDLIKSEGVAGVQGVMASSELLQTNEFAQRMQKFFGKPVTLGGAGRDHP